MGLNQIKLDLQEYSTLAYVNQNDRYYKTLNNKKITRQSLTESQLSKSSPILVGYTGKPGLFTDSRALKAISTKLRSQTNLINGKSTCKSEIVLLMEDGSTIIGNIDTIAQRITHCLQIKSNLGNRSTVDLEIGAFSHPLTDSEEKSLGSW